MKLVKTASGKKIKISKSEWQSIGKTAGWWKEAEGIDENIDTLKGVYGVTPEKETAINNEYVQSVMAALEKKLKWAKSWQHSSPPSMNDDDPYVSGERDAIRKAKSLLSDGSFEQDVENLRQNLDNLEVVKNMAEKYQWIMDGGI